ncbi:hypothetical protein [Bizionia sp. M204]|uniref:hypothetical protein n=1 Tax=unclassified Bizionia TaxID=2626393 RepID=UPI00204A61ED|nr:hypothetical protein [Bizionia sp. M204]UPS91527.1 hypothetical protein GMA17_07230 [Bizionia sp. M204]
MRIKILLCLILPFFSFSQKTYHFDYMLTYELAIFKKDTIKKQVIYLTNSKDNSYFVEIAVDEKKQYNILFKVHDSFAADVITTIAEFNKAEFINIPCEYLRDYSNSKKNVADMYDYNILNDTLMEGRNHQNYRFRSTYSSKKRLRKRAGFNVYIIDSLLGEHAPILTHPTAYHKWKTHNINLPQGIYIKKLFYNEYDVLTEVSSLTSSFKIDKKIVITGTCHF